MEKMAGFTLRCMVSGYLISELYSCGDVETGSLQDRTRLQGCEAAIVEIGVEKNRRGYTTGYGLSL